MNIQKHYVLEKADRKRVGDIISILYKYGLNRFLQLPSWILKLKDIFSRKKRYFSREQLIVNVRLAIEELGPTFVKFGQILSMRPDIVPQDLMKELEKLRDDVKPFPIEDVKRIIREDLGDDVESIYTFFKETPTASASIAQVHKAKLNGEDVAVKVRRPNITKIIKQDCSIMLYIASLLQKMSDFKKYDPIGIVEELQKQLLGELDFTKEIANSIKFYSLYENDDSVKIPKIYKKQSSSRIISMEFIYGKKLNVYLRSETDVEKRKLLAKKIGIIALDQLFVKKVFHADPHPGNIFLVKDHICLIDFGVVKFVTETQKKSMQKLVIGVFTHNLELVTESVIEMTNAPLELFDDIEIYAEDIMEKYSHISIGDINLTDFSNDMLVAVSSLNLTIPSGYTQMVKTLTIVEGICLNLYPDFSMIDLIKPYFEKNKAPNIQELKSKGVEIGLSYLDVFSILPKKFNNFSKSFENGNISFKLNITNMTEFKNTVSKVGNSFVFGIVTGSILIGSSLVLNSKIPPLIKDVSLIGLLGYGIAGIMGLIYVITTFIDIMKNRNK